MLETILNFLLFHGGALAFLMALGQLVQRRRKPGNIIIFLLLLSIGIVLIYHGFLVSGLVLEFPWIGLFVIPFYFFIAPLFVFFLQSITIKNYILKLVNYLHFIPGIVVTFLLIPFYTMDPLSKIAFLKDPLNLSNDPTGLKVRYSIIMGSMIITWIIYYMYFIIKNFHLFNSKYRKKNPIINYAIIYFVLTSLVTICYILSISLHKVFNYPYSFHLDIVRIFSLFIVLLLYVIYLMGKRYPFYIQLLQREVKRIHYDKSKIDKLDVESVLQLLNRLMEEEKIFFDEDLSLVKLANELSIAPYQLSEVLNERLNASFYDFINSYRIRESEKLLIEEPERSISSIAYAVGFNSLSAFYNWFLKITCMNPKKYREKHLREIAK